MSQQSLWMQSCKTLLMMFKKLLTEILTRVVSAFWAHVQEELWFSEIWNVRCVIKCSKIYRFRFVYLHSQVKAYSMYILNIYRSTQAEVRSRLKNTVFCSSFFSSFVKNTTKTTTKTTTKLLQNTVFFNLLQTSAHKSLYSATIKTSKNFEDPHANFARIEF